MLGLVLAVVATGAAVALWPAPARATCAGAPSAPMAAQLRAIVSRGSTVKVHRILAVRSTRGRANAKLFGSWVRGGGANVWVVSALGSWPAGLHSLPAGYRGPATADAHTVVVYGDEAWGPTPPDLSLLGHPCPL